MSALVFPSNPSNGQQFTAQNNIRYVFTSNKWQSIGSISDSNPDNTTPTISVGADAPSNPEIGTLWYNTDTGLLYVWYQDEDQTGVEGQWTDVRPPLKN